MVVETLWPDNAPWWLNLFIWMAFSWQWILIAFVPAFYISIVKLFGFPLLQRWRSEVVIVLTPTKCRFSKITDEMDSYIKIGKGIYWPSTPLEPRPFEEQNPNYQKSGLKAKTRFEELSKKETRTKKEELEMKKLLKMQNIYSNKKIKVEPINSVHIFANSVNQPIYSTDRLPSKLDDLANGDPNPKKIKSHTVWFMQNIKLHFIRHWVLVISPDKKQYVLTPSPQRQPFANGFWHSLGIEQQEEVETSEVIQLESGEQAKKMLTLQNNITTHTVKQQISLAENTMNMSAKKAWQILEGRKKLEYSWPIWLLGMIDMRLIIGLIGMVAVVAVIYLFMGNHSTPPTATPPGGIHPIL